MRNATNHSSWTRFHRALPSFVAVLVLGVATACEEDSGGPDASTDAQTDVDAGDAFVSSGVGLVAVENTATLPSICPASKNVFPNALWATLWPDQHARTFDDPDMLAIEIALDPTGGEEAGMVMSPFPTTTFLTHGLDYYARREELLPKMEEYVASQAAEDQLRAWTNLAYLLDYVGEFERVVTLFAEGGEAAEMTEASEEISLALGFALHRLGRYEEAQPHLVRAVEEIESPVVDAIWILMHNEIGLYGETFFDDYSAEYYTTEHVEELFTYRDWSGLPFEDVTDAMGIDRWGGTGSASFADLNGDGWDELIWERKFMPPQIYRNLEGQDFEPIPQSDLGNDMCSLIIYTPGDFDNDGDRDMFRHGCNYDGPGPRFLLRNDGDLKFTDVTEEVGLEAWLQQDVPAGPPSNAGMAIAWGDYDLDGYLDLLVGDAVGTTQLFHNDDGAGFTDVSAAAGVESPGTMAFDGTVGVSFGDIDGDRYPDIWLQGLGFVRLLRNNQDGTFTDISHDAGIDIGSDKRGYMSFVFDYNNDGLMDLFAGRYVIPHDTSHGISSSLHSTLVTVGFTDTEWANSTTIYRNDGDGTFTDVGGTARFIPLGSMGSNHGDWDNDGDQDIIMGTGGPMMWQVQPFVFYRNDGDDVFTLVSPFAELSIWGKGHGAAFSDFDRDGHLDLAVNNGGYAPGDLWPSMLLRNTGNDNHWIQVALKGNLPGTNIDAVGAKVHVFAGDLEVVQELWSGGRFGAANSFVLHFGLGPHTEVDRIVVEWPNPDLTTTEILGVAADQGILIDEATGEYETLWGP